MADRRHGPRPTDAAVVGMGAVFPGAPDLDTYRANLVSGADAIGDVPADRWDPGVYYDPDGHAGPARSDRFYCRRGGFIDDLAAFDPTRFGIMPAAVAGAEPDQLLALRVIAEAVADAGGEERLPADRSRIGVILGRGGFMGVATARLDQRVRTAHQLALTLRELAPELGEDRIDAVREAFQASLGPEQPEASIGLVPSFTAARTANRLDFRGPAYTLDAACASSLLAVDQAVGLLASGSCDVVVAGAVHHCHIATLWSVFTQLRALSPSQSIRPFDRRADGTLLSEGTGVVLLKRLADAERDGDRVYAVVRGVGVAGDGRAASLMSPLVDGQVRALTRAWGQAGLDPAAPDALGLLEAHGTGTPVGDRTELATLADVFGPRAAYAEPVAMGSVKSMLGHTMQASGMAGLIKAALAVHDGVLPPTLHLDEPHEDFATTRMRPVTSAEPWVRGRTPRRAGVNAFGFGGINAHVVLEEAPGARAVATAGAAGPVGAFQGESPGLPVPASGGVGAGTALDRGHVERRSGLDDRPAEPALTRGGGRAAGLPSPAMASVARTGAAAPATASAPDGSSPTGDGGDGEEPASGLPSPAVASAALPRTSAPATPPVLDGPSPAAGGSGAGRCAAGLHGDVLLLAADTPGELALLLEAVRASGTAAVPTRGRGPCRLAVVGPSPKRLALAAKVVDRGAPWRGRGDVWFTPRPLLAHGARLAFVFPGLEPEATPRVDAVADHFGLPRPALTGGDTLVERAVDAIAAGRFFARVLAELDVQPDLLAGHSLGEWTAMVVAGMYPRRAVDTFLDALRPGDLDVPDLVYAAVGCGARQAANALDGLDRVTVSHDNCPHQSVLCGEPSAVAEALTRLAGQGVLAQELPFRSGFHTPMWAPYLEQVRAAFARLPLRAPAVPVWSATTGAAYPTRESEVRDVVVRHLLEPVRFRELTAELYGEGVRGFVQMGAGSLPGFITDTLHGRDHLVAAAGAGPAGSGLGQLRRLAAGLWTEGLNPRWERLTCQRGEPTPQAAKTAHPARTPEPTRPAAPAHRPDPAAPRPLGGTAPHLLRLDLGSPLVRLGEAASTLRVSGSPRRSSGTGAGAGAGAPALVEALDAVLDETETAVRSVTEAWRVAAEQQARRPAGVTVQPAPNAPPPPPRTRRFRRRLSLETMPYVIDHCVYLQPDDWPDPSDRFPVVPMTTLLELAADAARQEVPGRVVTGYDEVRALRWLPVAPPVEVEFEVTPADDGSRVRVTIGEYAAVTVLLATPGPEPHPGSGRHPARPGSGRPARPDPDTSPLTREGTPPVSAEALYRDRWMFHGPAFAGVQEVTAVGDDGIRGVLCALPAPGALLDAAGQLLGHWMQLRLPADRLVFPASLERVRIHAPAPPEGSPLRATARIRAVRPGSVEGDVELLAADGTVWARLEGWTYRRFAADERVWPMKFTPEVCGIGEPQAGGWYLARRRWTDPASQELVMRRYLDAAERAAYELKPPRARAPWLLGRIAAKDALRHLLWDAGAGPLFPVEVPVGNDDLGRPRPEGPLAAGLRLSLAHKDRLAVAYAHPTAAVGIDIETVPDDPGALSRIALTAGERQLAEELAARERTGLAQALITLWCAKEAAAKAEGSGLGGRLRQWTVNRGPAGLRVTTPEGRAHTVRTSTVHDAAAPHVVAWTLPSTEARPKPHPHSTPTEAPHGI